MLLVPGHPGPDILLLKRAKDPEDPWSGQVGLPGGHREPVDATRLDTALREVREETSIRLAPGELVRVGRDIRPRHRHLPRIAIRPFVFELGRKPRVRTCPESEYHFWVPQKTLLASEGTRVLRVRARSRRVPAFLVGKHVIWGITYRILKEALSGRF